MEKQFIPYTEALALKELGFAENVLGIYYNTDKTPKINMTHQTQQGLINYFNLALCDERQIPCPLWQQAFDWFKEKYGLDVNYDVCIPTSYIPTIHFTSETGLEYRCHEMLKFFGRRIFDTKEEARIECLKKLIQVVKNK